MKVQTLAPVLPCEDILLRGDAKVWSDVIAAIVGNLQHMTEKIGE
jgi:hypothetical protein